MAEIRDPKRFYYAMRSKYMREAKQIGHKLFLATTDEEDALQWEKYQKVMKRWRALEKPEGIAHSDDRAFQTYLNWKPEFNDAYVELTLRLKELYVQMNQAKSKQERYVIEDKIRIVKRKRYETTTFTDRETGAPVTPKYGS